VSDDSITVLLGLPELSVRDEEETDYGIRVRVEYRERAAERPGCGESEFRGHYTCLFAAAAALHIHCDGLLLPFALAVLQGLGDVGNVYEVRAFKVGDGAADL